VNYNTAIDAVCFSDLMTIAGRMVIFGVPV